jgi:hypothetical protein
MKAGSCASHAIEDGRAVRYVEKVTVILPGMYDQCPIRRDNSWCIIDTVIR